MSPTSRVSENVPNFFIFKKTPILRNVPNLPPQWNYDAPKDPTCWLIIVLHYYVKRDTNRTLSKIKDFWRENVGDMFPERVETWDTKHD